MTKRKKTAEEKDAPPAKYLTPEWKALVAVVVAYARERDRWQGGVCELTLGLLRTELDRAAVAWAAAQGGERAYWELRDAVLDAAASLRNAEHTEVEREDLDLWADELTAAAMGGAK